MRTNIIWLGVCVVLALVCGGVRAETVILKSGDRVEGRIVRTEGSNVTVRTSRGFSTYHINELDQGWVDEHYDRLFTRIREQRMDEIKGVAAFFKGLVGQESLARATPFLEQNRAYVLPVSAVLSLLGLLLCFFGWKVFKFGTILGGVVSGILLGLILAATIATAIQGGAEKWTPLGITVFVAVGIPFAIAGAHFGRRFAMFGARANALNGVGVSWVTSIFALTRFAFFDYSVIWGQALSGALLIAVSGYAASVPLLALPDERLQGALTASCALALACCVLGAVSQIRSLRTEPRDGYRGEY